jgi:hypothetical protein
MRVDARLGGFADVQGIVLEYGQQPPRAVQVEPADNRQSCTGQTHSRCGTPLAADVING